MKISDLIADLQEFRRKAGNIEVVMLTGEPGKLCDFEWNPVADVVRPEINGKLDEPVVAIAWQRTYNNNAVTQKSDKPKLRLVKSEKK